MTSDNEFKLYEFKTTDNREGSVLRRPRKAIVVAVSQEAAEQELKSSRSTKKRKWRFFRERTIESQAMVVMVFSQQGE